MRYLRENTATRISVGPFLDNTDGVTPEIALTVTNSFLTFVVDDAGVPTLVIDAAPTASGGDNDMVHITSDVGGMYDLELTAAQTNYTGRAMLSIHDADVHCPVFHEFQILSANVYDSLFADAATDYLDVNTIQISGTTQTANDVGQDVDDILVDTGTTLPANQSTIIGHIDTEVAAILVDTGTTIPGLISDLDAVVDTVKAETALIVADTNELQTDDIPGMINALDAVVDTVKVDTAAIKVVTDVLTLGIITGACSGTPTTTVSDSDLTGYTDDQLIGRYIVFTSGNADGEMSAITDYANASGVITYDALTLAPAASDTFKIV